jgi:hypothetical protein
VPLEYWVTWHELRLCGLVIFTDHARHDGSSPDGPQVGKVGGVPGRQCLKVRGALALRLVRVPHENRVGVLSGTGQEA